MKQDIIEKLKEISNTQYKVYIGEQSIKRRQQLQNYYSRSDVSITNLSNDFTSNIISSINSVICFFKTLIYNEINNPHTENI